MDSNEIKLIIKKNILIERLELDDVSVDDIPDDADLFDEDGLALDSVEALDIMTGINDEFGIDTSTLSQDDINNFRTVNSMVKYIQDEN